MKKLLCIILVAFCACSLFGWGKGIKYVTASEEGHMAEELFDDGFYKNRDEIMTIVPVLTPSDITLLYNKQQLKPVKIALKNGLLGFGSGSFGAGDKKGGWIQLGCELGGVVIGTVSLGYMVANLAGSVILAIFGQTDEKMGKIMEASMFGMIVGAGGIIGGRVYGIIRGNKYPKQFNKDLQETLYGTSEPELQISFAPVFAPTGIGFGVGVQF